SSADAGDWLRRNSAAARSRSCFGTNRGDFAASTPCSPVMTASAAYRHLGSGLLLRSSESADIGVLAPLRFQVQRIESADIALEAVAGALPSPVVGVSAQGRIWIRQLGN